MSGEKTADLFLRRTPLARGGHRGRGRRQRETEGEGARSVGRESAEGRGGPAGSERESEGASDERGRSQEERNRGRPGHGAAKRDRMIFCYKQSDNRGQALSNRDSLQDDFF